MDIERRSFEIITELLGDRKLDPENELVIKRAIHTTADFDYADNLVFSDHAVTKGIEALRAGEIAGAGLDATEPEPADVASPLFRMENVIMTPHCGGSTKESKSRSSLGAAKGCDEVLTGKPITSPVL